MFFQIRPIRLAKFELKNIGNLIKEITEDIEKVEGITEDVLYDLIAVKREHEKLGKLIIALGKQIRNFGKRYGKLSVEFKKAIEIMKDQVSVSAEVLKAVVAVLAIIKAKPEIFGIDENTEVFPKVKWGKIKDNITPEFIDTVKKFCDCLEHVYTAVKFGPDDVIVWVLGFGKEEDFKKCWGICYNKLRDHFPIFGVSKDDKNLNIEVRSNLSLKNILYFRNLLRRIQGEKWKEKLKENISEITRPESIKNMKKAFELMNIKYEEVEEELAKKLEEKYKELFKKVNEKLKVIEDSLKELYKLKKLKEFTGETAGKELENTIQKTAIMDDIFDLLQMYSMLVMAFGLYNLLESIYYGIDQGIISKENIKRKWNDIKEKIKWLIIEDVLDMRYQYIANKKMQGDNRQGISSDLYSKIFGFSPAVYRRMVLKIKNLLVELKRRYDYLIREIEEKL